MSIAGNRTKKGNRYSKPPACATGQPRQAHRQSMRQISGTTSSVRLHGPKGMIEQHPAKVALDWAMCGRRGTQQASQPASQLARLWVGETSAAFSTEAVSLSRAVAGGPLSPAQSCTYTWMLHSPAAGHRSTAWPGVALQAPQEGQINTGRIVNSVCKNCDVLATRFQ